MIAGKIFAVAVMSALVACSLAGPMYDDEAAHSIRKLIDGTNKETRRFIQFMSVYKSTDSFDHVLSDFVNEFHLDKSNVVSSLAKSCAQFSIADLNKMQEVIEADDWEHAPNDKIVKICQAVKAMEV